MDPWPELVELYEYKVADVLSGREPRGGRRSLFALRDTLLYGTLESALMRRFRHADRLWRDHTVSARPAELPTPVRAAPELDDWSLQSAAPTDPEGEILSRLAQALWRLRLDEQLAKLASGWRREGNLISLRSLYALSLNLEAGALQHDVPELNDPLVSLSNPEIAQEMLVGLIDQLLAYRSDSLTPIAWARSMVIEMTNNPFPSASRAAREADHGLRAPPVDRTVERTQVREALLLGFEAITRLLSPAQGGSGDAPPSVMRALFARQNERRLDRPDDTDPLALRLAGPGEIHWRNLSLRWQSASPGWQLQVAGATYRLNQTEGQAATTRIPLEGVELRAVLLGEHLLLNLERGEHASLAALVGLARPVAALLEGADAYLHLRLARGVAQWFRDGRFDATSLGADSADKYAVTAHDTLLAFARKGAENLLLRMGRRSHSDVRRAFKEVARGLQCPEDRALRLLELLQRAAQEVPLQPVAQVEREGEVALVAYQGEPITVNLGAHALTLRADYRGEVTAVMPGAPALPVNELQVFTLERLSVMVVRQGLRLAVTFQKPLSRA